MSEQPERHFIDAKQMTLDDVLALFTKLTGRPPTPEEVDKARRVWESEPT
jgi:hypothetical protein